MQRALSARAAYFPLLCLLALGILLGGCRADSFTSTLKHAEDDLSLGNRAGENLAEAPPLTPPAIAARHTIALVVDSILSGDYNAAQVCDTLTLVRKDPFIPRYLKVEAGYLLVLLGRLEEHRKLNEEYSLEKESRERQIRKNLEEKYVAENERLRRELDELKYKLQKIEEIHISTEKKRGIQ